MCEARGASPRYGVITYCVMGEPLFAGAVQRMVAVPFPAAGAGATGAPGAPTIIATDGGLAGPGPFAFEAVTTKV